MDALFHIKGNEFDENLFRQIKALLMSNKSLEVTIAIGEGGSKGILRKETKEQYFSRLDRAIENLNDGNSISFNAEEFEDFSKQLLNEP